MTRQQQTHDPEDVLPARACRCGGATTWTVEDRFGINVWHTVVTHTDACSRG